MTVQKHTFCRICEPNCPMIAEIGDDGAIARLVPDREHPVSRGYACHKGLSYAEIHTHPDRVNQVLRRTNPRSEPEGRFEAVGWDEALADIGARLRAIREAHGPDAIASYQGNPKSFNTRALPVAVSFPARLGTRNVFGSASQDMTNKAAALYAIYGSGQWTIPDFAHTDYLLCIGANPKVSHWTLVSVHWPMQVLQDIVGRGGTVKFINPRRVESVSPTTGELVQIKPDTDVYLLAAMIHEIDRAGGFDEAVIAAHGRNVEQLRAFVAQYPAERVAEVVGIAADDIRELARGFRAAPRAAVHVATGVNQGRQGTLAYWLANMLSFVTGNLGREGGNYCAKGPKPVMAAPSEAQTWVDTPVGRVRRIFGQLAGNLMPDLMACETAPVRALVVVAGNPLLSVGGEARLREIFANLELIVVIDLFRNATAELADYVLPATDWLEREDLNHFGFNQQPVPYIQLAEAVTAPLHDRRHDWWIVARIMQEVGLANVLDEDQSGDDGPIELALGRAGITRDELRASPSQTVLLPQADPGRFYAEMMGHADGRVDCCPAQFADALVRCEAIFAELAAEDPQALKLITLRTARMHNSWMTNLRTGGRGRNALNPLHIHPEDAARLGLAEGAPARVSNANGMVEAEVRLDESLRPGVVAMSHGFGHAGAPGLKGADLPAGANVNRLVPTGPGSFEPISNMAHMNGITVRIEPLAAPVAAA
ncbi:molybdopterin-dependent oxidoreductase [Novosphingobium bradum]|uniref:Molybdopterin-dependent oxidoreductase n=1 Tax=Novosphingobium bradum TaxID=1737444 RepID=A0ABV7ILE3_9SPHN